MTTVASFRHSEFETTCAKCGEPLIAPEWSEFVSEGLSAQSLDLHELRQSVRNRRLYASGRRGRCPGDKRFFSVAVGSLNLDSRPKGERR